MFLGTWNLTMDGQGYVTIPGSFRAALREGMVVTRGFERCLQVFPPASWQSLAGRIGALPLGAQQARLLRRMIFADAAELAMDRAWRVQLPPRLRAYADLQQEVVIAGLDSYCEIWSRAHWQGLLDTIGSPAGALAALSLWHSI